MRHRAKGRQLSRTSTHRRAMLRNMATSLFAHGRVITTEAKAKELRPYAEKLITLARPGGYTRILKLGHRPGDGADLARIELLAE